MQNYNFSKFDIDGKTIERTVAGNETHYMIPQSLMREGNILFYTDTLENIRTQFNDSYKSFYDELIRNGIENEDIITFLNYFYPHGNGENNKARKGMNKGFGSKVLEKVIEDSFQSGAKAIFGLAVTSDYEFFQRRGIVINAYDDKGIILYRDK